MYSPLTPQIMIAGYAFPSYDGRPAPSVGEAAPRTHTNTSLFRTTREQLRSRRQRTTRLTRLIKRLA